MKYLKKFNEELSPRIYRNASKKLSKIGHIKRSQALIDWASTQQKKEEFKNWKENIELYKQFGTYKFTIDSNILDNDGNIKSLTDDFYLFMSFDSDGFGDIVTSERAEDSNFSSSFCFYVGIIPTNEETIEKCNKLFKCPEFDNGFYWSNVILMDFEVKGGVVSLNGFEIDNYDENLSGICKIADRKTAVQLKNLLISIFTDKLNYPSSMTNVNFMYNHLENSILIENSFSSDYGFKIEQLADFVGKLPINSFYIN